MSLLPEAHAADSAPLPAADDRPMPGRRPGMGRKSPRLWHKVGTLLIVIALLALLELAGTLNVGGVGTIPKTTDLAGALLSILGEPDTYAAIGATFLSWSIGFAISVLVGILVGLVVGISESAARSTRGLFDFLRSTPAVALIPMVTLMLGIGLVFKVTIIVLTCLWVILLQMVAGLGAVDKATLDSAHSLHMTRWQRIRWVLVPTALPFLLTGMRLVAVYAFLASISVELIASSQGLGREILFRQLGGATDEMWAFVVLAAVLGVLVSFVFTRIEAFTLRWHVSQRDLAA